MLSKQIKNDYMFNILFISVITLFILTLYIVIAIYVTVDIVFLLIIFIFILMGLTAFFSISLIKLSLRYQHKYVKVILNTLKELDIETIHTLSFGKDAKIFHRTRYQEDERFIIESYNFKYARIQDQHLISYILSTEDVEVVRD
jgi:hypothetical protein